MSPEIRAILYLLAAVAFIVGLKRLSGPRTARSGNLIAAVGMLVAIVVTLFDFEVAGSHGDLIPVRGRLVVWSPTYRPLVFFHHPQEGSDFEGILLPTVGLEGKTSSCDLQEISLLVGRLLEAFRLESNSTGAVRAGS